jgi:outer membrane protein OmpA-like peptidoglycan-associated protein
LAPADLHKAHEALGLAEESYKKDSDSYRTRDLAYVAQRKAEMASAQATIVMQQNATAKANKSFQDTQGAMLEEKTRDLTKTRTELASSQKTGQETAAQLSVEQAARVKAEQNSEAQRVLAAGAAEQLSQEQAARRASDEKAKNAQNQLAKLAALKEDERGMVITLSGSIIFRSNEAVLMPGAQSRLDLVYDALSEPSDRNIVVEGYTDSQGSDEYNRALSQRRANAVRDYLVGKGYPSSRVQARGMGEGRPIADNATAEGRANNRRVEIIIQR